MIGGGGRGATDKQGSLCEYILTLFFLDRFTFSKKPGYSIVEEFEDYIHVLLKAWAGSRERNISFSSKRQFSEGCGRVITRSKKIPLPI